ncbi:MAG: PilZ domain-containing protein [Planctomycetota bacterium]|nr:MAG: PilZ domain-containing protein [Planctomycetota bacterium]
MNNERRNFVRFLTQDTAFAVFRPHFSKLGKINNISRGGLAFEYISFQGQKEDSSAIDIFLSDRSFHLTKIPCKIIYDIKINEGYQRFGDPVETRLCGLQFGELTQEKAAQLNFFLNNHTTERASSTRLTINSSSL